MTARIDDRKALCTGITRVIAVLPADQWASSLSSQVTPTIQCIEMMVKGASLYPSNIEKPKFEQYISRMSEEIGVLAIALRTFNSFAKKNNNTTSDVKAPLLSLLNRIWPTITSISRNFSAYEVVVSSLSDFLLIVVSLNEDGENLSLIAEAVEIAIAILDTSTHQKYATSSINPILNFVEEAIDTFGHQAELHAIGGFTSPTTPLTETMHKIVQHMVQKSFSAIPATGDENNAQEDILPGIFAICRACIRRCPVLLMTLSYADGNFSQSMFAASLGASVSAIGNRQAEVVRDALLYLNDCVSFSCLFRSIIVSSIHTAY